MNKKSESPKSPELAVNPVVRVDIPTGVVATTEVYEPRSEIPDFCARCNVDIVGVSWLIVTTDMVLMIGPSVIVMTEAVLGSRSKESEEGAARATTAAQQVTATIRPVYMRFG
jgi:hypothetical protein